MTEIEYDITKIEPIYDFQEVSGGYFEIYFGYNHKDPFKVSFVPFLERRVKQDQKLYDYLKTTSQDKTVSDAIFDLYDIGFPVDSWVKEYVEYAKENVSVNLFNALVLFFNTLQSPSSGSKDDTEMA